MRIAAAPVDIAGIAAQENWNNLSGAAGGPTNLLDQSGANSGASISWQTDEQWSLGNGVEPNSTLLVGWISAQNNGNTNTIDISNILKIK